MENEFILADAGIQPPTITEMQRWQPPHPDPLFHTNGWDAHSFNPMVSSPAGSNPHYVSNESFLIRELIGKLGGFGGNPPEIVGTSCYSTPLSSPPKLENSVTAGVRPNFAEFAADPGFVERAARFSCFGSRSFNDRTGSYIGGRVEFHQGHFPSAAAAGELKLGRVSSSPSLNGLGPGSRPRIEIGGSLGSLDQIHSMESPEEESSVIEPVLSGETGPRGFGEMNPRKRKGVSNRGKAKEPANATMVIQGTVNSSENSNAKRCKSNEGNRGDDLNKKEGDGEGEEEEKQNKIDAKPAEPPKDYIHVRARRGQATDSHSLAERVRREKISERMKLLQDLVPGCNKVTGKALMLDEIINYVQSLQRQVEFLSMKLASVNTSMDAHSDSLLSKDHHHMFPSSNTLPHHMFPGDSPSTAATTDLHGRRHHHHHPHHSHFTPPSNLQYQGGFSSGGDDLHSIVQMGLGGQSSNQDTTTSLQRQGFHY